MTRNERNNRRHCSRRGSLTESNSVMRSKGDDDKDDDDDDDDEEDDEDSTDADGEKDEPAAAAEDATAVLARTLAPWSLDQTSGMLSNVSCSSGTLMGG